MTTKCGRRFVCVMGTQLRSILYSICLIIHTENASHFPNINFASKLVNAINTHGIFYRINCRLSGHGICSMMIAVTKKSANGDGIFVQTDKFQKGKYFRLYDEGCFPLLFLFIRLLFKFRQTSQHLFNNKSYQQ